ncbi:MAG TPA: ribosomal protein S18-alanine N-acetyltransferase [Lachnospiraceae bacterium]|nr:ribosomal protein S18-alanine N-acetyltransferase [Lachnospiraceae bacterium]
MQIRKIQEKDLDQVSLLEKDSFSMPWSKNDFINVIEKEDILYLVVEENGIIIGNCGVRNIVGEGEITNVVIKKDIRNQGLGFAMLQELLVQGQEMGIKTFTLEVREGNKAAICVYKKLGFVIEGIRKGFYSKPVENAVIMWKR